MSRPETQDDEAQREAVMQRTIACRDEVLAYLLGLTRELDRAEDLLQESILVICRHWRDYDPERPFMPWAIGIAKRTFLGSLKGRHRRLVLMESELLERAFSERPHDDGTQELFGVLSRCIEQLSERQRRCFDLRYRCQLPYPQISKRLAMSAVAVRQLLTRTRRSLRECVARRRSVPGTHT